MLFTRPELRSSPDCVQGQPWTASLLHAARGNAYGVHQTDRLAYAFFFHKFFVSSTLVKWIYFIGTILILLGRGQCQGSLGKLKKKKIPLPNDNTQYLLSIWPDQILDQYIQSCWFSPNCRWSSNAAVWLYAQYMHVCLPLLQETKKRKFSSALTLPNQAALQHGIWPYMAILHWEPGCLLPSVSLTVKHMYSCTHIT